MLEIYAEVANKILKKYGVLIDASTLSDESIDRILARKNFPKIPANQPLRVWNDRVFGVGERVGIFLSNTSLHQNTHLRTVQAGSLVVRECFAINENLVREKFKAEIKLQELNSDEEESEFEEIDFVLEDDTDVQEIASEVSSEESETLRDNNQGERVLQNILDELDGANPCIKKAVELVLVKYENENIKNVFDMVIDLMRELTPALSEAQRVIGER